MAAKSRPWAAPTEKSVKWKSIFKLEYRNIGSSHIRKDGLMTEKLIIVMANTDPRNGEELGAPIFQATVAAAMEYEVDVICTATSGRLMRKGVA